MLELHVKLEDFVETHIEVGNYWKIVKDKYVALDFLGSFQVEDTIEKFKRKHLDITLG